MRPRTERGPAGDHAIGREPTEEPARRPLDAPGASTRPGRGAWAALAAVALVLVGVGLGGLDLWAPDEPRYARVAEELRRMERGPEDLVLLRLGGEPYTQKPPLYFWLAAGAGALEGGVSEWSARLPSAAAALATLALWAAIGRRLFPGTAVGWMCAALLLTSFRFAHFARRAQLDVLLVLFESLALWAFLDWRDATTPRARRRALALLHGATALALLTKGPVGLLPWACFVAVLWSEGRLRAARDLLPAWGVALAAGPVLLWVGASVALAPAGFFEAAVVDNVWARFATGTAHVRPFWYFVLQLPVEALPWSLLWPWALWAAWRARRGPGAPAREGDAFARRLLLVWIALPFVFFSLSAGKRGIYLLPVLPALCLALAAWLDRVRATSAPGRRLVEGPALALLLCGVLGAGAAAALPWRPEGGAAAAAFDAGRVGLLVVAATGAAGALGLARRCGGALPPGLVATWGVIAAVFGVLFFAVLPELEPEKSPRPIAAAVREASAPGDVIGLFDQPALLGGLLFYLDDLDDLDDLDPDELAPAEPRTIALLEDPAAVARFVEGGGRVVVSRSRHAEQLDEIGRHRSVARLRSGRRAQSVLVWDVPSDDDPATFGDGSRVGRAAPGTGG